MTVLVRIQFRAQQRSYEEYSFLFLILVITEAIDKNTKLPINTFEDFKKSEEIVIYNPTRIQCLMLDHLLIRPRDKSEDHIIIKRRENLLFARYDWNNFQLAMNIEEKKRYYKVDNLLLIMKPVKGEKTFFGRISPGYYSLDSDEYVMTKIKDGNAEERYQMLISGKWKLYLKGRR